MKHLGTFYQITYTSISIGRQERWMEPTGEVDDEGLEIFSAVREPTQEDLEFAAYTEAGNIRFVRATMFLPMIPTAQQAILNSERFDINKPAEIESSITRLMEEVHRESSEQITKRIKDGGRLERIPDGQGFNYRFVENVVSWTGLIKKEEKP